MTTPLEDRIKEHLVDIAANDLLPGPDTDAAFARTIRQAAGQSERPLRPSAGRRLPLRPLAVAAAILAVCLAATGLIITQVDDDSVRSGRGPDAQPTPPTTQPQPATSVPATTSPDDVAPPALPTTSVIVGPHGPIGWWDGNSWNAPGSGTLPVSGGEQYKIVSIAAPITTGVGGWGDGCGISAEPGSVVAVDLPQDDDWRTPTPIAVTGVASPQPRPVRLLPTTSAEYRTAAVEVLSGLGIDDPNPTIGQVVAADLDGDGTDEVIVVAERLPEDYVGNGREGDYSVAFVRQVVGGSVTTTVFQHTVARFVFENVYDSIESYRVAAIADFNGDGRLEIAGETIYWEGSSIIMHELRPDRTVPQVFDPPC